MPDEIIGDEQYRACFAAWLIGRDIWVDTFTYDWLIIDIGRWRGRPLTEDEEYYLIEYMI